MYEADIDRHPVESASIIWHPPVVAMHRPGSDLLPQAAENRRNAEPGFKPSQIEWLPSPSVGEPMSAL